MNIRLVWSKIINFSLDNPTLSFSEVRRIRILNASMLMVCLFTIAYLLFLYTSNKQVPFVILVGNFNLFGMAFLVYSLHFFRLYYLARFVIIFGMAINFTLVATSKLYNTAHATEHYLFVVGASCFFLLDRLRFIIPAFLFVVVCYIFIIYNFGQRYPAVFVVDGAMYIRIGIAFSLLFLILNFFRQEQEKYQKSVEDKNELLLVKNAEIAKQRDDMIESINYARRIQTALLPIKKNIQQSLPQLLLCYLPKDIVSGDFYWFSEKNGKLFLAIADCTGHGVPGAFMTVIGANLLDLIINKDEIASPAQILSELDTRLLHMLQQQTVYTEVVHDGMDISLLQIDPTTQRIIWAGAKRNLWIFEAGKNTPTEYKGDKFPIGSGQYQAKIFTEKEIQLKTGDIVYAFTDGFADQFGAEGKFTLRRFREFLQAIFDLPFEEQERLLVKKLEYWRGKDPQTDDVLVIAFAL